MCQYQLLCRAPVVQFRIAVVQSTDPSSTSVLAHVISDRREVVAVTSTESLLFVLRNPSQRQIEVYDVKTFRQQRALQVKDLSNRTLCYYDAESCGLTSCVTNNCIYVSDYSKDTLHKIELSGNNGVFSWHVDGSPGGLSLNTARNLLVACYRATKIQEYTTNGSLLREIDLKSTDGELRPLHVLQLTGDQFVVSCWNESNRIYDVAEIDSQGRVVLSYTNQLQSTTRRKFKDPRHLAFDKNNDLLLVADMRDNRIVMLNRSLNCCERELDVMSVGGLQSPSCLYFDVAQNRLIVGEGPFSQYRVLVIELSTISV
jgi:DNA-binding beta-propeller fold protein YncE